MSAFLRRTMVEGLYGAVLHKGAEEAGAVFVLVNHLDGTCHLFGPAPAPLTTRRANAAGSLSSRRPPRPRPRQN